jgi:hypothetical protein
LKTLPNFLIFFTKLGHCIQAFIFYNGQRKTLLFIVLSNFKLLFQKQNVLIAFYAVKMKHKCVDLKKKDGCQFASTKRKMDAYCVLKKENRVAFDACVNKITRKSANQRPSSPWAYLTKQIYK